MKTITTQIQINAPAGKVWKVLTDLGSYAEWNPFITHAEGWPTEGSQLSITISPPNSNAMSFTPHVIRFLENQEFRWLGQWLFGWLFEGEHIFQISSNGSDSVIFEQREHFRGILVPFIWKNLNTNTRLGFEAMNAALKERAEETVSTTV